MELNKGLQTKLFALFFILSLIPFLITSGISAYNTIDEREETVKRDSLLRNAIISEHITEFIEKNQFVLKSLAMSPTVIEYVQNPTEEKRAYVEKILRDTDEIFNDSNLTALTGANGWQMIRTDGSTLVNLNNRQHFQEAMKGRSYVSDIILSMSTGKMVVVIEVPVLDYSGKPVGMIQRNLDLVVLQEYVQDFDYSGELFVVVMDRTGRVIANSNDETGLGNQYDIENAYKFILDRIYNSSGVIRMKINNEDSLASYSRNVETGWMIIAIRPYHYVYDQVYNKAILGGVLALLMLAIEFALANFFAKRVSKPIIEISQAVDNFVSGKEEVEQIEVSTNDELGQVAVAFNKLRSERDDYKQESELDKLTELFNKKTMENLCRMKLNTYNENTTSNIFMAFYVIDLDHFKEVNDFFGHQFGDEVLVEFSRGLKKIFRSNDYIGRFGGDEFVVIVNSLPNMEVVIRKAEQIKLLAFNLVVNGKAKIVTASIGIAIAPQNGRDYETLFAAADKALYHVKRNGKNGYHCEHFSEEAT